MQKGFWNDLLPFLNGLHADHLVLEFARRGYDELEVFKDLDPRIGLGIGVMDIKDNEVESARPHRLAHRARRRHRSAPERVRYVHPDCGFWMLQRSVADRQDAGARRRTRSVRRTALILSVFCILTSVLYLTYDFDF